MSHPSLPTTGFNTRNIYLCNDGGSSRHFRSLGLCTTHAPQTGGYKKTPAQISILRDTQFQSSGIEKGIERTMNDTLRTDIHPSPSSHLSIIGNTHLHGGMPVLLVVVKTYHQRIGYNDTWRFGLGLEQPQRMSAFNDQCLFLCQDFKILLDKTVLHPVLANLSRLTVRHQLVRIKGYVETQIIVYHHLKGSSLNAFSLIFINRFRFKVALRTITISVNPSTRTKFFHELGSKGFMQFFRNITQGILQRCSSLRWGQGVTTVGRPADTFYKSRVSGQSLTQSNLHSISV